MIKLTIQDSSKYQALCQHLTKRFNETQLFWPVVHEDFASANNKEIYIVPFPNKNKVKNFDGFLSNIFNNDMRSILDIIPPRPTATRHLHLTDNFVGSNNPGGVVNNSAPAPHQRNYRCSVM